MCSQSAQGAPPEKRSRRAQPVVAVDHVSMIFNMASERIGSLKEYAIKAVRRELMFKEFKALDDVSFTVERGDVFGLMGTNGSGKSTMLKIIAGVLEPSLGTCEVNGVIAPLIELGAGFDMELSARENIYLNGALLGYSKQFMEEHFDNIVEFADVEGFLDMPMKNYSSGMVARIAFAIATEVIPDILIVDEVLSVGDFMFQQKCERRIRSLIEDYGVTVLIVSHDSDLVERLCNKAIWIEKGRTKALGDASEVCGLYRTLGGHIGSEEAAEMVQKIFESQVGIPTGAIATLYAENRYASATKLAEAIRPDATENVILAPGSSEQICLIANSLAGLLDASVLLYREDYITDATLGFLLDACPERVILFEGLDFRSDEIVRLIQEEVGCQVQVIAGNSFGEISLNAYHFGLDDGRQWSRTFMLTHDLPIVDRIALAPYAYAHRIPLFYHPAKEECISAAIANVLLGGQCDDLLVVGSTADIPDNALEMLVDEVRIDKRFCYRDGYEAAIEIAKWIVMQDGRFSFASPLIVSALEPANALTLGSYAAGIGGVVLFEDPRNLESVVVVSDLLRRHKDEVAHLTFVGDLKTYAKADRELLAKSMFA